jgi:TolA-binding protein
MGEPAEAIVRFESLQKEYPKSAQNDLYLHGLVVANVKKKQQRSANKFLSELKLKFPSSVYIQHAETSIAELAGGRER